MTVPNKKLQNNRRCQKCWNFLLGWFVGGELLLQKKKKFAASDFKSIANFFFAKNYFEAVDRSLEVPT